MKIINHSKFFDKPQKFVNLNRLSPQHPYRMLVVGPSNTGKTNVVVDMVLDKVYFDNLYVIAGDLDDDYYRYLARCIEELNEEIESGKNEKLYGLEPKVLEMSNNINFDIKKLDKKRQNVVIVDDMITETHQDTICELFTRIRKLNGSIIYITQSYFETPKLIRQNCNYLMIFNIGQEGNLHTLLRNHCVNDMDKVLELYNRIHMVPYRFLMIDKKDFNYRCCYEIVDLDNMGFHNL